MSSNECGPASDAERRFAQLLETAIKLAELGEPVGREICASIFLHHAPLLVRDPDAKRRLIGCLLLLDMPGLLGRVVRAVDGVELTCTTIGADGTARKILALSNGVALSIPAAETGADRASRQRFAAYWSHRLAEALTTPPAPLPPAPLPPAHQPDADPAPRAKRSKLKVIG